MAGELAKYWQAAKKTAAAAAKSNPQMKTAMADLQGEMSKNLAGALDKMEAALGTGDSAKIKAQQDKVNAIVSKYAAAVNKAVKDTALTGREVKAMRDALVVGREAGIGGRIARMQLSVGRTGGDGNAVFDSADAKLSAKWLEKHVAKAYQRGGYDDLLSSLRTVDHFAAGRASYGQTDYDRLKARFDTFASEVTSRNPNPESGKAITKMRKQVAAFASTVSKHVAKVEKEADKRDASVLGAVNDQLAKLKAYRKTILTVETAVNELHEQAVNAIAAHDKEMIPAKREAAKAAVDAITPKLAKAVAAADKLAAKIPGVDKIEKLIGKVFTDEHIRIPTDVANAQKAAISMFETCQKALADAKSVGNQVIGKLNAVR